MIEVSLIKQESGDLVLVSITDDAGNGIMTGLTADQAEQTASELLTAANELRGWPPVA